MDQENKDNHNDNKNPSDTAPPPGKEKSSRGKEKSIHRAHSTKKDAADDQSQPSPSPKTPSTPYKDFMADTESSKNKHREKVPLTPGVPAEKADFPSSPAHSQSSPRTPVFPHGDYRDDTTASKNRHRDKVPLSPGFFAEKVEKARASHGAEHSHHEPETSRIPRPINNKRNTRRPTPLKTEFRDFDNWGSPLRSAVSIEDPDATSSHIFKDYEFPPKSAPASVRLQSLRSNIQSPEDVSPKGTFPLQKEQAEEKVSSIMVDIIEVETKINQLEQQLAQAVAENEGLKRQLQQRNNEGRYLSEEEWQNLSRIPQVLHEGEEFWEARHQQCLEDIELWKAKCEQAQQQLEEQRDRQRQQQKQRERSPVLSPIKREGEEVYKVPKNEDLGAAYDDLRLDYADMRDIVDQLRAENKSLLDGVPKMRRENEDLKQQLASCKTHSVSVQNSLDRVTAECAAWETEYKVTLEKLEKKRIEFETELEKKNLEMEKCVREYRDRMPEHNGEWWDIQSLQRKLVKMEQDNDEIGQRLEAVKKDKQAAYQEGSRLRKELSEMKQAVGEDVRSGRNTWPRKLGRGSWDRPEARAAREKVMNEFREEKRMERERSDREEEILEQIRKWYMKQFYPPSKKSYAKLPPTSWHRWHGDEWLDRGATHIDARDKEAIDRLRR